VFRCKGFGGLDVRVAEGDLRMFVSYGPDAAAQTAAQQTVPAFNTTGETLEWRLADGEPFATILRFHWDSDGAKGSTLVVTFSRRRRFWSAASMAGSKKRKVLRPSSLAR
jgi:hypothetical protein